MGHKKESQIDLGVGNVGDCLNWFVFEVVMAMLRAVERAKNSSLWYVPPVAGGIRYTNATHIVGYRSTKLFLVLALGGALRSRLEQPSRITRCIGDACGRRPSMRSELVLADPARAVDVGCLVGAHDGRLVVELRPKLYDPVPARASRGR